MGVRIRIGSGFSVGRSGLRWSGKNVSVGRSGVKLYGKAGSMWIPNKKSRATKRHNSNPVQRVEQSVQQAPVYGPPAPIRWGLRSLVGIIVLVVILGWVVTRGDESVDAGSSYVYQPRPTTVTTMNDCELLYYRIKQAEKANPYQGNGSIDAFDAYREVNVLPIIDDFHRNCGWEEQLYAVRTVEGK